MCAIWHDVQRKINNKKLYIQGFPGFSFWDRRQMIVISSTMTMPMGVDMEEDTSQAFWVNNISASIVWYVGIEMVRQLTY